MNMIMYYTYYTYYYDFAKLFSCMYYIHECQISQGTIITTGHGMCTTNRWNCDGCLPIDIYLLKQTQTLCCKHAATIDNRSYCPRAFTVLTKSGLREAPPTRKPSMSDIVARLSQLPALTEPVCVYCVGGKNKVIQNFSGNKKHQNSYGSANHVNQFTLDSVCDSVLYYNVSKGREGAYMLLHWLPFPLILNLHLH